MVNMVVGVVLGLILGATLVGLVYIRRLKKSEKRYLGYQKKVRKTFRIRRLENLPDAQLNEERQKKGLPPVTENKNYLWVVAIFGDDAHAMALTDREARGAIRRAKKNDEDWKSPKEVDLDLVW